MNTFDFTVGQIGARIILEIVRRDPISGILLPLDVSSATTKDIVIKKPDDTKKTFTGAGVIFTPAPEGAGDGSDGLIEAVTTAVSDLDQAGQYETASKIVKPGEDGFTQIGFFTVGANL